MKSRDTDQRRTSGAAERLLSAARELLDADGADCVTIRATARKAGVSHAAPANHFSDRRALLTALAAEDFTDLADAVDTATAGLPAASVARARAMADAVLAYALRHSHRYRLLWRTDQLDQTSPALEQAMERLYANLLETAGSGDQNEHMASASRSLALWSLVHGYASLVIDNMFSLRTDETSGAPRLHAMIDLLFTES